MGYFQVRYDSRVVNYDRRGFIGLATDLLFDWCRFDQTSKIVVKQLKPNKEKKRSAVKWYFPSWSKWVIIWFVSATKMCNPNGIKFKNHFDLHCWMLIAFGKHFTWVTCPKSPYRYLVGPLWPDADIKGAQILLKVALNVTTVIFLLKMAVFQTSSKSQ